MKASSVRSHLKTAVLFLFVAGSLVLSDLLAFGNFDNPTETGLPQTNESLSPSSSPTIDQVLTPTRILSTEAKPIGTSVALPGSRRYLTALALLETARVSNLHTVMALPTTFHSSVAYEYASIPASHIVSQWLAPHTVSLLPNVNGMTVYLIATKSQGVQLAMQVGSTLFLGQTNADSLQFQADVQRDVTTQPWSRFGPGSDSYLPNKPFTLPVETWQTTDANLLPVIHSFFVNPQILTRIRENATTILWTDGSLAVQWNQTADTLLYQDPNTTSTDTANMPPDETALAFIRNHGGGPSSAFLSTVQAWPETNTYEYQLITYRHGVPVLSPTLTYDITVRQNLAVNFSRPLWSLVRLVHQSEFPVLTAPGLRKVLLHLQKRQALATDMISLGYVLQKQKGNTAQLVPVYHISTESGQDWLLRASTGAPIAGGDIQ